MDWIWYATNVSLAFAGWILAVLGLPGLWLIALFHVVYGWVTGWQLYVGWQSVVTLLALATLAEVLEFTLAAAGSRAAGGSVWSMIGAIAGGLIGSIVFLPLPVPVLNTLLGACIGAFAGAAAIEYLVRRDHRHALRVGRDAFKGRVWGMVAKGLCGVAMVIVVIISAWPR